jgi:hypothetical protein
LGVALYAGRFGIVSRPKGELLIYGKAPTFQLLNHVYNGLPSGTIAIGTDFKSFYMLGGHPTISNGAFIFVVKFDQNGVFQPLQWVLPVVGYDGNSPLMGVNRSGTILYYGQGVLGGKVNRHDITTNSGTALSPFITSPGPFNQYVPAYVIVMSDNSICCYFRYYPTPSNQDYIYHYAPDGTLLRAISLSMLGNTAVGQYICHSSDDGPDTIWIWYYTGSPAKDGFLQLRLSDGAILQQFSGYYLFNSGKGPAQLSTEAIWGPETGGAMIPMMFTPGISGMYFFNPAINHDSYYNAIDVKIPNPTVRLPYVGE